MLCRNFLDVEPRKVLGMHDGSGVALAREVFSGEFDSPIAFLHHTTLMPDAVIGMHPHDGTEEVYVILSGTGRMSVDDESRAVGPGDVVLTKSGSRHALSNTGDGKLEILVFMGRL